MTTSNSFKFLSFFLLSLGIVTYLRLQLPSYCNKVTSERITKENQSRTSCPHSLLISRPRHGSTWFIDSIEHCRYSRLEQIKPGSYGMQVYNDTELWHVHAKLASINVHEAADYLRYNNSVKIFRGNETELQRLGKFLNVLAGVPVVVLRRRPKDACRSLFTATQTGLWNGIKKQNRSVDGAWKELGNDSEVSNRTRRVCNKNCRKFRANCERETNGFFDNVEKLLHRNNVQADWLWYEDVKNLPVVPLKNAGCVVRNCNFLRKAHAILGK